MATAIIGTLKHRVKDETYPDGHWELVGPTTIDLTDYATKEEVSDLKDYIDEQIKKYLPLSGGNYYLLFFCTYVTKLKPCVLIIYTGL